MTMVTSARHNTRKSRQTRSRSDKRAAIAAAELPIDALAAMGGAFQDAFEDAFLADWIDSQLGEHEARLSLILHVSLRAADEDERTARTQKMAHLIEKFGGCLIERQRCEVVGVWGQRKFRADDAQRALSAARAITLPGHDGGVLSCVLHAGQADVARRQCHEMPVINDHPLSTNDTRKGGSGRHETGCTEAGGNTDRCNLDAYDFLIGEIRYLARSFYGEGATDARILLTEPFKAACALGPELLPVSFPGYALGTGDDTKTLYVLAGNGCSGLRDDAAADGPTTMLQPSWHDADNYDDRAGTPPAPQSAVAMVSWLDWLGDLKPVIQAAALAGPSFSLWQLARMLKMEPKRLWPALDAACTRGLIQKTETHGQEDWYSFCSTTLHGVAYAMVPAKQRLRLHRKAAEALCAAELPRQRKSRALNSRQQVGPPRLESAIARHYLLAKNELQTRRWLRKAAWKSIADGHVTEAVEQLRTALADADADHASSALNRGMLQLLSVQLAVTQGNGADVVFRTNQKSTELAEVATPPAWGEEFRSLWLAQSCHLVKGEVRAALTIGSLMKMHSRRLGDDSERALGQNILIQRMQALALLLGGHLKRSFEHYDFVLQNYDLNRHALLRFAYGSDQAALSHAHLSWLHTIAGARAKAHQAAERARLMCEQLEHAHTTAHVMSVLALAALTAGDRDEALLAAQDARAIAMENGFEYWVAWADVVQAADNAQRAPRGGYRMLEAAMRAYQATGAQQLCPFVHLMLGMAAIEDGQSERGLAQAIAGLALTSQNGCVLYGPALLRLQARAAFATGDVAGGEAALHASFQDACSSGALLFAQQAARDGARLTRGHAQIEWQTRFHSTCQALPE